MKNPTTKELTKDFRLKYDLDRPETPNEMKMAKEFLDSLGAYCLSTKSKSLQKLMNDKEQLLVSEVLRAISFNGEVPFYSPEDDFDNFHSFVTRYMIESGWLTNFPDIILDLPNIAMLRLSIFKYILTNWNWIASMYSFSVLDELAENYGKVSLENSAIEEDGLRKEFIRKVLKQEIAELEQTLEGRVLKITAKSKRHDYFSETNTANQFSPEDSTVRNAVKIILDKRKVSPAMLQIGLKRGYNFVVNLISWLEEVGAVEKANGTNPRKILISSMDEFDKLIEKDS